MGYITFFLFVLVIYQYNKLCVLDFKNIYYKTKLDVRGIESTVEDVKTIFDIMRK